MARTFRTRRRVARKPRDLIWIATTTEIVAADTGTVGGEIINAGNWSISTTGVFERATLLRVVGTVSWNQTANATNADIPWVGWIIYKDAQGLGATLVDPTTATAVGAVDCLHWDNFMLTATASGSSTTIARQAIDIKSKRKLDSGDGLYISTRIPADTASPTANMVFTLRWLIDRN